MQKQPDSAYDRPRSVADGLSVAERVAIIRKEVTAAGDDLRIRFPMLRHQDAIGATILGLSIAGMLLMGWLYYAGYVAWYVCVPISAVFAGLTQEIEHDLIHLMYFRKNKKVRTLLLWLAWLARPNTVSPFTRTRLHMYHHMNSGMHTDLEEQFLTNGHVWGIKRLVMTSDLMLSLLGRPKYMLSLIEQYVDAQRVDSEEEREKIRREQKFAFVPLSIVYYALWYTFIIFHVVGFVSSEVGATIAWSASVTKAMSILDFLAATWLAPNALRMFCLNFVSSNMHYFGDIEEGNLIQQCQVMNAWWLWPIHLFCCNFGSTHGIHHFVVKETFYVRQMTAGRAHAVMRDMGVRFNDFGNIWRANRWGAYEKSVQPVDTAKA